MTTTEVKGRDITEQTNKSIPPLSAEKGLKTGRGRAIANAVSEFLMNHPETEFSSKAIAREVGVDWNSLTPILTTYYHKAEGMWQHIFRTEGDGKKNYMYYFTLTKDHRNPRPADHPRRKTAKTRQKEQQQQLAFEREAMREELRRELVAESERLVAEEKARNERALTLQMAAVSGQTQAERVRQVREGLPPARDYKPWAPKVEDALADALEPPTYPAELPTQASGNNRPFVVEGVDVEGVCFVCGEAITEDSSIAVRVKLYGSEMVTRFIHSPTEKAACWGEFAEWRNAQAARELAEAQMRIVAVPADEVLEAGRGMWDLRQVGMLDGKVIVRDDLTGDSYVLNKLTEEA